MFDRLINGDALTRAEAFSDAEDAAAYAPTTANRLRYALALSVPGHPRSDPVAAATRLRDLIAAGNALLPAERRLATLQLQAAEQQIVLQDSRDELERQLSAAGTARDADTADQIRRLQADNQRLSTVLGAATEMLEAITNIEESISEREGDEN
jgi:hypothetical protein